MTLWFLCSPADTFQTLSPQHDLEAIAIPAQTQTFTFYALEIHEIPLSPRLQIPQTGGKVKRCLRHSTSCQLADRATLLLPTWNTRVQAQMAPHTWYRCKDQTKLTSVE